MNKNDLNVIFSHKSDNWSTPQWLFDKLNETFKFTLDACASPENAKCNKFYTKEDDGLTKSFSDETVFINPPYSKTYEWVKKAHSEALINKTTTVMLLPARTDTKWFHEFCMDNTVVHTVAFVKGRLKFGTQKNSAPFPSMVVVFKQKSNLEILFVSMKNRI